MFELVAGVLIVVPMVLLTRRQHYQSWFYSLSLVSLPLIYMGFGVFAHGEEVVMKELLYGLPFILTGLLALFFSFKHSAYLVAILWFGHGGYDLYHDYLFINNGVWSWYPLFCAAIDVTLAGYIFYSAKQWPQSNIRLADEYA